MSGNDQSMGQQSGGQGGFMDKGNDQSQSNYCKDSSHAAFVLALNIANTLTEIDQFASKEGVPQKYDNTINSEVNKYA